MERGERARPGGAASIALSLLVAASVGVGCKLYAGPGAAWIADRLAGAFYVIFWCFVFFAILRTRRIGVLAAAVTAATCALEFLQLVHPPFLEAVRAGLVGRTLLGAVFSFLDLPFYFLGGVAAYLWMGLLAGSPPER
ncbi:MAG: DUF2809 domain-containing protein [Candidatus Eisenbacteria bacterium]|nr:DUF2809 domain-containing protein [Candidatus Eisenbacteria bacterium]